jgi:hypothetical protein
MILGGTGQGSGDPKDRWKAGGGCSPRHFLRLRSRYDEDGLEGLKDRRVGRVSHHRAADAEIEELTRLYPPAAVVHTVPQLRDPPNRRWCGDPPVL